MHVQFLYTKGCPYNDVARSALHEALIEEGLDLYVEEIEIRNEEEARRWGFAGSPTILIDGMDVSLTGPPGLGCRAYVRSRGDHQGWPNKASIRWLLKVAQNPIKFS